MKRRKIVLRKKAATVISRKKRNKVKPSCKAAIQNRAGVEKRIKEDLISSR